MSRIIEFKRKTFKVYELSDILLNDCEEGFKMRNRKLLSHLKIFMYALNRVEKSYYVYDLNKKITAKIGKKTVSKKEIEAVKQTERVFAYELYHQWSCNLCHSEGWVLNAEIKKNIEFFCNHKSNNKDEDRNYPDLILHKGQEKDGQLIVCEIKRVDRLKTDFVKDIESLSLLLDSTNSNKDATFQSFKYGLFLTFCSDFDSLIKTINDEWKHLRGKSIEEKCFDKILCVTSNCNSTNNDITICFQSLGDLIRQLKKEGFIKDN